MSKGNGLYDGYKTNEELNMLNKTMEMSSKGVRVNKNHGITASTPEEEALYSKLRESNSYSNRQYEYKKKVEEEKAERKHKYMKALSYERLFPDDRTVVSTILSFAVIVAFIFSQLGYDFTITLPGLAYYLIVYTLSVIILSFAYGMAFTILDHFYDFFVHYDSFLLMAH